MYASKQVCLHISMLSKGIIHTLIKLLEVNAYIYIFIYILWGEILRDAAPAVSGTEEEDEQKETQHEHNTHRFRDDINQKCHYSNMFSIYNVLLHGPNFLNYMHYVNREYKTYKKS